MDSSKFDILTKSVVIAASRRQAIRGLAAGLAAAVLGRAGLETASAQLSADACVDLGSRCKKKKGEPKPRCCGRARCRNGRCACGNNTRKCGKDCITRRQCCRDNDCPQGQACRQKRCKRVCLTPRVVNAPGVSGASKVPGGFELVATQAPPDAAVLAFDLSNPIDFDAISRLSTKYNIADGNCNNGAIRFSLLTTGSGAQATVFVAIGPDSDPNGVCPVGSDEDTGNLITDGVARFQYEGTFYTAAEVETELTNDGLQIEQIALVADVPGDDRTEVFVNPCVQI